VLIKSDPFVSFYSLFSTVVQNIVLVLIIVSFVSSDCDFGEYGAGCKQKCGRCANMSDCDRYTGECPHGCGLGYYPPFCQESEFFTFNT